MPEPGCQAARPGAVRGIALGARVTWELICQQPLPVTQPRGAQSLLTCTQHQQPRAGFDLPSPLQRPVLSMAHMSAVTIPSSISCFLDLY